jgi:hypothetical protein
MPAAYSPRAGSQTMKRPKKVRQDRSFYGVRSLHSEDADHGTLADDDCSRFEARAVDATGKSLTAPSCIISTAKSKIHKMQAL